MSILSCLSFLSNVYNGLTNRDGECFWSECQTELINYCKDMMPGWGLESVSQGFLTVKYPIKSNYLAHLSSCLVSLSGYVEQVDLGIETTQATPGCWTQNQLGEASGWSDGARRGVTAWPALQSCGMRWPLNNNTLVLPFNNISC